MKTVGGGAADASAATPLPDGDLALQLAGLQYEVQASRRRMLLSGLIAGLLLCLLLSLLLGWRAYHVRQFAELAEVTVQPSRQSAGEVEIRFQRESPGKVEFTRQGVGLVETLVDYGSDKPASAEPHSDFVWAGGDGDYTLTARYRSGWSLRERRWSARGNSLRQVD
ncbi:MAG: hypothetical protein ACT4QC_23540 [Planctomycetaceae bacterium]